MKRLFFVCLVVAASALIVVAFFMPWAKVATSVTGISKEVTKSVEDTPYASKVVGKIAAFTDAISAIGGDVEIKTTVTGFQVPKMVNDESSKVALSLAETLFNSPKGIDKKSYLVYLLPGLAVVCAFLAFLGLSNRLYVIPMLLIGGAISIAGLYNLYTMDVSSQVVQITIMDGLWYSMYSFLFIFLVGIVWLLTDRKKA